MATLGAIDEMDIEQGGSFKDRSFELYRDCKVRNVVRLDNCRIVLHNKSTIYLPPGSSVIDCEVRKYEHH